MPLLLKEGLGVVFESRTHVEGVFGILAQVFQERGLRGIHLTGKTKMENGKAGDDPISIFRFLVAFGLIFGVA